MQRVTTAAATPKAPIRKPKHAPQPLEAASLPDAFLRMQTVIAITGLSQSSIFRRLAADPPQFPEPVRMGKRCTRWRAADVRDWLSAQVAG